MPYAPAHRLAVALFTLSAVAALLALGASSSENPSADRTSAPTAADAPPPAEGARHARAGHRRPERRYRTPLVPNAGSSNAPRPRLTERLERFWAQWSDRVPTEARGDLRELGATRDRLAAAEADRSPAASLEPELLEQRRVLRAGFEDALVALHPQVRAAMRRHHITIRHLARHLSEENI